MASSAKETASPTATTRCSTRISATHLPSRMSLSSGHYSSLIIDSPTKSSKHLVTSSEATPASSTFTIKSSTKFLNSFRTSTSPKTIGLLHATLLTPSTPSLRRTPHSTPSTPAGPSPPTPAAEATAPIGAEDPTTSVHHRTHVNSAASATSFRTYTR